MTALRLIILILLVALTANAQQNSAKHSARRPPASCQVTVSPGDSFTPPGPYRLDESSFWLGTEKLWTVLQKSGVWAEWKPHEPGKEREVRPLSEKTFWMSVDFDYRREPYPDLRVTGRRLDGSAPPLLSTNATNAFPGPTSAMLTGVYIPAPGCWEITGEYRGQKLSFVVWVTPEK